ncbi:MAG: Gfo/Idh/MocA family oxidoreductase [Victivallales bacterium]
MSLVSNPDKIGLGIIGMTEGNGHPFSWSAIFNGYDQKSMTEECPFAGIPAYLNKETKDTLRITGANVTHICCDNRKDAEKVAKCSLIPHVVDRPEDFIGNVDAVIIATDIGGEHVKRARPFIEAGLPVFIDKPLCDNRKDLEIFRKWVAEENKPVMSSSCMRYAKEFMPYHRRTEELGQLRFVSMPMAKKWETYGIHALEAIYPIVGPGFETIQNIGTCERNIVHMTHKRGIDIVIACIKDVQYGGALRLSGTAGNITITSNDTFYAFKAQLQAFVDFLRSGKYPFPFSETDELMQLVIGGIESRENKNKIVNLK